MSSGASAGPDQSGASGQLGASGEVRVERIAPGGAGLVREASGRVVFVPGALPGDRLRLGVVQARRGVAFAESFELLEEGPGRVTPSCADQSACGGCDLMQLDADTQRAVKLDILRQALERTGGFASAELPPIELRRRGDQLAYRSRIRLRIEGKRLGFHSAGSHRLVEPAWCRIASPEVRELFELVRARLGEAPDSVAALESVELRSLPPRPSRAGADAAGRDEPAERHSFHFVARAGAKLDAALRSWLGAFETAGLVRLELPTPSTQAGKKGGVHEKGGADMRSGPRDVPPAQRLWLSEDVFAWIPVGGFSQVNLEVNRGLIDEVLAVAAAERCQTVLDLYSGAGNFSLPLAHAGLRGLGIEWDAAAVEAARRAATEQGLSGFEFRAEDVARGAARLAREGRRYDLLVLDPPRAGARDTLDAVARLAQGKVLMISCDPVTLARDLAGLVKRGARLERIEAWDMFPQTHHVETLALLSFGPRAL